MNLIPPAKEVRKFLFIFYLIGIIGFVIPQTQTLFTQLIPLALLMNLGILLYFHRPQKISNYLLMFCIAFLGFSIEIVGVQSGLIFGEYAYGTALGPKFMGTPYMIGINWLVLTYTITIVLSNRIQQKWLIVLLGAFIVTGFDVIMEPIAIHTGMWNWGGGPIPIQNYLAWFVLSLVFIWMLRTFSHTNNNKLAGPIFFMQLFFFTALLIIVEFILK